ncbi:MAG: hypothetical protein KDA24_25245 [Deltaproteobacteria bacterium]|nr:hypothetical protein [Deltaproteobacteria bacterium]
MRRSHLSLPLLAVVAALAGCPASDATSFLSITPEEPDTTDDLSLEVFVAGEATETVIRWVRDGEAMDSLDDAETVPAASTNRGELWVAQVTVLDGATEADSGSAQVLIGNAPPALAAATLDPATATEGTTLTCEGVGFTDPDGDTATIRYQWFVDGAPAGEESTLSGGSFDEGELVWCGATPFDGEHEGEMVLSSTVRVGNSPPAIAGAVITPNPASVRDTLGIALTGWADPDAGDDEDFDARWFVNDVEVAAGTTLPPGVTMRGDEVVAEVRPVDEEATGPSVSTDPITVGNAPPSLAAVTIDHDAWLSVYRAVPSGWLDPDGDAEGYVFEWTVDGLPAGAGELLAPFPLSEGQEVVVTAFPDDGLDLGEPVASEPLLIGAQIVASPNTWSFGDLEVGCSATQDFIIENLGVAPGLIQNIGLDDLGQSGAVTMTPVTTPELLLPGESLTVTLTFLAEDLAGADVQIVVETDSSSTPVLLVPVTAGAHHGPTEVASFLAAADQYSFPLASDPVEATLTVEHNGAPVTLFTWDEPSNTVWLDSSLTVLADDVVDVTYALMANSCAPNGAPVVVLDILSAGGECDQVTMTGVDSSDPDGDPLIFEWSLDAVPAGSALTSADLLLTAPPDTLSFEADMPGDYGISLTVLDAFGVGSTASVLHSVAAGLNGANSPPLVNLGSLDPLFETLVSCATDAYGVVTCPACVVPMVFTTEDVYDPDSVTLSFAWTMSNDSGSETLTVSPDGQSADVAANVPGDATLVGTTTTGSYELLLEATDCEGASGSVTVTPTWACVWQ